MNELRSRSNKTLVLLQENYPELIQKNASSALKFEIKAPKSKNQNEVCVCQAFKCYQNPSQNQKNSQLSMVASKERKMVISHQMLRGSARVQVVNENGNPILDDQVQEGQLFIVPQNHGVITQAGNEGFEYIAFKTNDNAMISTLAGRTSILRALPLEVLANAYQIQRQQAHQLKYNYNRQETIALSSSQSFQRRVVA
ncbi:hypothetical protein ACFX2I_004080 [Malus domestica]